MSILLDKEQELAVKTNKSKVLVAAAAGSGKALENGSIVYTKNGQKKIEELEIGEFIYCEDGNLHKIIGIFPQGKKKKYIVKFTDKTEISCCNEHLWTFQTSSQRSHKSKNWNTKTLKEIIENYPIFIKTTKSNKVNFDKRRNLFIPMTSAVSFIEKEVPLDPYTLGALLGDGHLGDAGITSQFSNRDKDIIERVNKGLKKIGCNLSNNSYNDCNYPILQNSKQGELGTFNKILRELKLNNTKSDNKFIPNLYKYNSVNIRLNLLKGLIDTDGYCDGSSYDITLKSKQLILDIKEICESLGFTAVYQEKIAICSNSPSGTKNCGKVYRLRIKTSKEISKIHFCKKRENQYKTPKVFAHRSIEEIIETDEYVEMTCISVDNPTSLFLTNNFIVTHNTRVITERLKYLLENGENPNNIYAITYTNMAAREMRERIGNSEVFIGTIHSLANRILLINGIDTSNCIEEENFDELFIMIQNTDFPMPQVDHLLIDEFQDICENEYIFTMETLNPKNFFVVGDSRQAIYSFKGANYKYFMGLVNNPFVYTYELNNNYRCGSNIIDFADDFLNSSKDIYKTKTRCASGIKGNVLEDNFSFSRILEYLKDKNYKDWFILCRTNNEITEISNFLSKQNIDNVTFKKSEISEEQMEKELKANKVKVLTIHSAKGLESKNVIVIGGRLWSPEELRICYVAATRAKENLIWLSNKRKKKIERKTNLVNWG